MKPLLLDTHVLLWWIAGDAQLSAKARKTISSGDCRFSMAGCWEMAIKASLRKLTLDRPLKQFLAEEMAANGITLLPIEFRHTKRGRSCPFHHRDPFDRLLIAQAIEEDFTVISRDECLI